MVRSESAHLGLAVNVVLLLSQSERRVQQGHSNISLNLRC
jgi:hypothetical protein